MLTIIYRMTTNNPTIKLSPNALLCRLQEDGMRLETVVEIVVNLMKGLKESHGEPIHEEVPTFQYTSGRSRSLDLWACRHLNGITYSFTSWWSISASHMARPEVIESNGLATPEAYAKDLAYVKRKFMRPPARDKKIQEECAVPLKKFDDISEDGAQQAGTFTRKHI
ncbi:hypothetical protein L1987_59005 [Smallanthus sonchifolius]|uniref:Uncharacterized protein n=1 Tax=Smallanthus sonchifolius TaxID=185202 RepID=A0ACB9D4K4_9ASTR|nr:hypothetical protein L1987_59005 [Smallanthus sonchifolius]